MAGHLNHKLGPMQGRPMQMQGSDQHGQRPMPTTGKGRKPGKLMQHLRRY